MKDRERIVVSGILSLLVLTWLGFLFHTSPRFAAVSRVTMMPVPRLLTP